MTMLSCDPNRGLQKTLAVYVARCEFALEAIASQAEIIQQIYSVLRDYSGKFTVGDLVKFILSRVAPASAFGDQRHSA